MVSARLIASKAGQDACSPDILPVISDIRFNKITGWNDKNSCAVTNPFVTAT